MKTKAIIMDLDGTVVDSPGQKLPSKRLVKLLGTLESEYFLCAATGRSWNFAKALLHEMNLKDFCILSGGTQICIPTTGEIILQKNIDRADAKAALKIIQGYPNYKMNINDMSEADYLLGGTLPKDLKLPNQTYFMEQSFLTKKDAESLHAALSKIPGIACTLVVSQKKGFFDVHVTNRVATKEHAINFLLNHIGVRKSDSIGIGDGNNDIHLFKSVGYKVAMGNAVPALKDAADKVIGSVKDDGLSVYLQTLLK